MKRAKSSASNAVVELRADWGWLDIRSTRITSWDNAAGGPDTETDLDRRAFVHARSTLDPDGATAHESRMDVIDSEISYLGSHNTEAYGLTWKVVDTTAVYLPPGSGRTLFDVVKVHGDILNSHLHHNFFGAYSYGLYGGHWAGNEVDHNVAYGFDPHDNSDHLVIENNNVHHNGWHGIIASKRCDHGVLRNNRSWNNGLDLVNPHGNGIMLHRSCDDWVVENNQSYGNPDSGIAIFASDRTLIRNNTCTGNTNAALRMNVGSADNWVEQNQFKGGRYGFYLFQGFNLPEIDDQGGPPTGRCRRNTFTNNQLQDYTDYAIKVSNSDSNSFLGNVFISATNALHFERGTGNLILGNLLPANALVKLVGDSTNFASASFNDQPQLNFQLDLFSAAGFSDPDGGIFACQPVGLTTYASPDGSTLMLYAAVVGTGLCSIQTRNFFVLPASGTVQVNVTSWSQSSRVNKSWTIQASSGSVNVDYCVGDLTAGDQYSVKRGSSRIATLRADSQGYLSFSSSPGATTPVTYTVSRK